MSKTKTHCLEGDRSPCGIPATSLYANGMYKELITCPKCKKSDKYKSLPRLPRSKDE